MKIILFAAYPGRLPYESNHASVEIDESDLNDHALSSQEVQGLVDSAQGFLKQWKAERQEELGSEGEARLSSGRPSPSAPPTAPASPPPTQQHPTRPRPALAAPPHSGNEWDGLMRRIEAATGRERKDFEMHFFRGCAWFKAKDSGKVVGIGANQTFQSLTEWKPKWAGGVLEKCIKAVKVLEVGDEVQLHYNIWNRDKKVEEWREIRYRGRAVGLVAEGASANAAFSAPVQGQPEFMPGMPAPAQPQEEGPFGDVPF